MMIGLATHSGMLVLFHIVLKNKLTKIKAFYQQFRRAFIK